MRQTVKVAKTSDVPVGKAKCVEVAGQKVALFNVDGKYYAIADTCTHRGGPLSEGEVEGTAVTCPWHGASFDLTTGGAMNPPARVGVACFRVQVTGEDISIETP